MSKEPMFTYQTRIENSQEVETILGKTAELLSRVERCLFADHAKGKKIQSLKSEYLQKFGITARQFNAIRVQLEGKIDAIVTLRKAHIDRSRSLIEKVEKKTEFLEKKASNFLKLRKKKQQLYRLRKKLDGLIEDQKLGKVRLCFGSKKLFQAQFHLADNGYSSHEEWKRDWHKSRNDSFFTLGSKEETTGNQTCIATVCEDGTLTLRLRLPNALSSEREKYLVLEKVYFPYGHEVILAALDSCSKRQTLQRERDPSCIHYGQAISYRFKQDDNNQWYVFASTSLTPPPVCTHKEQGAIGIDLNANHIAVVEIDHEGNPVHKVSYALNTYGKSPEQSEALIGDVVAKVAAHAKEVGKPLVIEELDFTKKKDNLKNTRKASYARMLSSFAYNKIITFVQSRGYRNGVEVLSVDPAFTSVIGRVKYAVRYGLTLHESAALCIARRGLGVFEKVPRRLDKIPDGKGGYVALTLPVRKRDKYHMAALKQLNKKLAAELAAHFWAIKKGSIHKAAYS